MTAPRLMAGTGNGKVSPNGNSALAAESFLCQQVRREKGSGRTVAVCARRDSRHP